MTDVCDFCGAQKTDGYVSFSSPGPAGEPWRYAAMCETCREEVLEPALRALFGDGAHNLNPGDFSDLETEIDLNAEAALHVFESSGGTWHVAEEVVVDCFGVSTHTGACGITERNPDRSDSLETPLSTRLDGVDAVCGRCAASRPGEVIHE